MRHWSCFDGRNPQRWVNPFDIWQSWNPFFFLFSGLGMYWRRVLCVDLCVAFEIIPTFVFIPLHKRACNWMSRVFPFFAWSFFPPHGRYPIYLQSRFLHQLFEHLPFYSENPRNMSDFNVIGDWHPIVLYLVATSPYEDYGPWRPSQGYYRQSSGEWFGCWTHNGGETGSFSYLFDASDCTAGFSSILFILFGSRLARRGIQDWLPLVLLSSLALFFPLFSPFFRSSLSWRRPIT